MYLLWQVPGNIWLWTCSDCFTAAPVLSSVVLGYLIFAYFAILVPAITLLASCLCAPCVLLVAISLLNSNFIARSESVIASLQVEVGRAGERCTICANDMGVDSRVVNLGCEDTHTFHEKCVKRWLRIKMCCPICHTALLQSTT